MIHKIWRINRFSRIFSWLGLSADVCEICGQFFASLVPMQRPAGITAIAVVFFLAAAYLWMIDAWMLAAPGTISATRGAQLMYGLEQGGRYAVFLIGIEWVLVGWGLLLLHNWARWLAMLVMVVGMAMLVPKIGAAEIGAGLLWDGLQIALRAAVAWYLAQAPAAVDSFSAH